MKQMKQWMHWVLALVLLVMSLSVSAAAAETITVNVTNTPVRGSVALEKTGLQLVRFTDEQDEWGNTVMKPVYQQGYLKGAVFELRAAADVVGKEGTVFYKQGELVQTLTTSADGAVNSKPLPLGSYCLQEVSAPDGYLLDDTPYPFTLTAAGKQTAVVEVKVSAVNTYLPIRVTLHKQQEAIRVDETADGMIRSSIETVPGEGCVFGLFNAGVIAYGDSQKLPAHTLMATGITDAKGKFDLLRHVSAWRILCQRTVRAGWLAAEYRTVPGAADTRKHGCSGGGNRNHAGCAYPESPDLHAGDDYQAGRCRQGNAARCAD